MSAATRVPAAPPAGSGRHSASTMWSVTGPDGSVAAGWLLLPLRLFMGVTFLFAGLQKLADPQFLKKNSPSSIYAQLVGASHSSPIHSLTAHLVSMAPAVGLVIAVGEVAIGLGVLVGLWMRVAAGAGMILSFSLFLAVSFHASPYFNGSDIVFFFAWTPFVLAGAAGAPALDTWLAGQPEPADSARPGVSRRDVLSRGALTGMAATAVVVVGGLAALVGRLAGGTSTPVAGSATLGGGGSGATPTTTSGGGSGATPTTTSGGSAHQTAPPRGTAIGAASNVPVGGSAAFTDPSSGDPALVIQQTSGDFVAFDAICPHAGCTVAYQSGSKIIACPCHGSEFNARTGNVIRGPATNGLTSIAVTPGPNGDLYVAK